MAMCGGSIPIGLCVPAMPEICIALYMAFKASFCSCMAICTPNTKKCLKSAFNGIAWRFVASRPCLPCGGMPCGVRIKLAACKGSAVGVLCAWRGVACPGALPRSV